jgi:hypothetical protein
VPKRLLDQRWPWLVAAGVIVLVFLSTFVDIRLPGRHWDRARSAARTTSPGCAIAAT